MNNFNNILTKTESLATLQGGIENSEGGGGICWTLASYILLRFFKKKLQNFTEKGACDLLLPPLNRPMHYLH